MKRNWFGQRVLIIGAARQGLALARYLAAQGAQVTLNDQRSADKLADAMSTFQEQPLAAQVRWELGGHSITLLDNADLVCISGGVPLDLPIITEANRRGMLLTNDSQIFFEEVQASVIGITGSAGKTTTTTLVGRMAEAQAARTGKKAWVGGNIGLPLVEYVHEIKSDDLVVVELSSFQLEQMTISPQIGAVLNITPNHLDRHGTMDNYTAAKSRILTFQRPEETAVLNREDPGAWGLRSLVKGNLVSFGIERPAAGTLGTFSQDGWIWFTDGEKDTAIMDLSLIRLRGGHNQLNVLAACAVAAAAGWPVEAMRAGVEGFTGVPHRLEYVTTYKGADWYNNSIATAPERTIAAIQAFDEPLVLLLGGRDKKLPWEKLAELAHERAVYVIVFGEASEKILQALGPLRPGSSLRGIQQAPGLQAAIQAAANIVQSGDVVLLSPGGTSFDEFKDFEERGERFQEWVKALL